MMLDFGVISLIIFFSSGLISYVLSNKHFLLMLISLELLVLSIYTSMFTYFFHYFSESFTNMIYLSMSVCEGALGLSLLVILIRTHGMDMVLIFDNLW
uniref:NADH-ubiquinone oxidoreductase chain 4L n=1 Tax=Scolytinae sp. BMNH 1274299 TaxID=2558041 RepID=A0A126TFC6_9CUCU|nr:NADH dehydrogenase subunit 4L [Scolytinae sp. BMNH 1274299]